MYKWILFIGLVIYGIQRGSTYLFSEDFQKYGDDKKLPWTCTVNNVLGQLDIVGSHYPEAQALFERTMKRCPDSPAADLAEFKIAYCLESIGYRYKAHDAYKAYYEKHPNTARGKLAQQSADMLAGI